MLCPNCKTETLITTERQSVQIDHCPQCKGIWLDRGELEKLVQMASIYDERRSERYNGREPTEEDAQRKKGYSENYKGDDDDDERETYQGRERDDDRDDERGGGVYKGRDRDDDDDREPGSYGNRDRGYDQRSDRGAPEGKSIWREIFDNLGDRMPRP